MFMIAYSKAARGNQRHHSQSAARLLKKMVTLGISRFDPDPIAAIEAATLVHRGKADLATARALVRK